MIIDAHAHAASEYSSVDSIKSTANKYELEKIVLCTSPKNIQDLKAPPNFPFMKTPGSIYLLNRMLRFTYKFFFKDNGDGNKYVFELKSKLPETVIQFLWVNPLDPQHMANLDKNIHEYKVKGIKLHQAWDPFSIDGRQFNQLVEVAEAHRLPIFIHLYSRKETRKLLRLVGTHREVIFIIAHMLGLDIFKEHAGNLPNVYFDTSGSERVRGQDILEAIQLFGHDHIVFGTDTPYARIGDQIEKIERLNLSENVKEAIFRLNFQNILSLSA
jgi:predicted TIM-barrel fold metal-dependent hydrolase